MKTEFEVHGPFPVPTEPLPVSGCKPECRRKVQSGRRITESRWGFWDECHVDRTAIGCYIFALKRGDGYKPLYVGKTCARTGFGNECFTHHKRCLVADGLGSKGQLVLFLLTPHSVRRTKPVQSIGLLEQFLIAKALDKNPNLGNKHFTSGDPFKIHQIYPRGPGRTSKGAKALMDTLTFK